MSIPQFVLSFLHIMQLFLDLLLDGNVSFSRHWFLWLVFRIQLYLQRSVEGFDAQRIERDSWRDGGTQTVVVRRFGLVDLPPRGQESVHQTLLAWRAGEAQRLRRRACGYHTVCHLRRQIRRKRCQTNRFQYLRRRCCPLQLARR